MKLRPGLLKRYAFAAPTYFGAGAVGSGSDQYSVNAPGGTASGDILLVVWRGSQVDGTANSTGYTHITGSPATGTTSKLAVMWKRATGSSNNIGTFPATDISTGSMALMTVIRGCRTTGDPYNIAATTNQVSGTAISIASMAVPDGPSLVMYIIAHNTQTSNEFTVPVNANLTSITERTDVGSGLGNGGIGIVTGVLAAAGASGTFTTTKLTATDTVRFAISFISH